nr:hypothetical protein [Ktedonobacteraceae bacterium]
MDQSQTAQLLTYEPWLIIAAVAVLFILLRTTRQALRKRVDTIGYQLRGERGLMIWFWLNAPGVALHELSHAFVVLLLRPFGFRITSIALFRIKQIQQRNANGRVMKNSGRQALQLGEVQYVRPERRFITPIGDGLSAVAPLFGGIAMLAFLYWIATGYNLWDFHPQILRPGWPWWTLIFTPYLILTVTSELWPSKQDWRGARWFIVGFTLLTLLVGGLLWYARVLVFNNATLHTTSSIATHIDYVLLILLAIDIVFLVIADLLARIVRG